MPKDLPAPELLRKLLRYEPETGKLFWRKRSLELLPEAANPVQWNARYAGKEAFTYTQSNGYVRGAIFNRSYLKHRIIWVLVTGRWPEHEVDHINGNRSDNRWCNLREANSRQNKWNSARQKNSTSGFKGVSWHKSCGQWRATISDHGKHKHLGYFPTPQAAYAAYQKEAKRIHGAYAKTPEDFL